MCSAVIAPSFLQTGNCACEHPTAPFARYGACARAWYREITRFEEWEGAHRDRKAVGGWNEDENGDGDDDGTETGTRTGKGAETRERTQERNGVGTGREK